MVENNKEKRYSVDPDKTFQKSIEKAIKLTGDLTIPLTEITKMWYKGNRSMFTLKGPGKYKDISEKWKKRKSYLIGSAYPINEFTGETKEAITNASSRSAFNQIVNKQSLLLGVYTSDLPYAGVNQYGYKNRPARPFLLTGAEQVATDGQAKAISLYTKILNKYVKQATENA